MVLPEEASPSRVQGWICSGWSCHSSGQACSTHELCWCSRECCWKPGTAWPALTFLHLAAEILTKTGKWKGGNSLVCSHLLPCATKPRELEMEEKHSKVNNCVIFGAFFRKFGEAEQPPAFSTQGRSCGGDTAFPGAPAFPERTKGISSLLQLHQKLTRSCLVPVVSCCSITRIPR